MSKGGVHNALSRGSLPSALARALGDMEGSSGLERYGETLTPILDLWNRPEWAYLRGEILVAFRCSVGAVAGEFAAAALINPAGSGLLVVLEQASSYAANASLIILTRAEEAIYTATLGLVGPGYARDGRWAIPAFVASGGPSLYSGTDAASPIAGSVMLAEEANPAAEYTRFGMGLPIILKPGQGVGLESLTANLAVRFNFTWRQRRAFPGELE